MILFFIFSEYTVCNLAIASSFVNPETSTPLIVTPLIIFSLLIFVNAKTVENNNATMATIMIEIIIFLTFFVCFFSILFSLCFLFLSFILLSLFASLFRASSESFWFSISFLVFPSSSFSCFLSVSILFNSSFLSDFSDFSLSSCIVCSLSCSSFIDSTSL